MEARRRWATGIVTLVAIVVGGAGAAYIWKEAFPTEIGPEGDGGLADAGRDARAAHGKSAKKGRKGRGRPGKPHATPNHPKPNGGVVGPDDTPDTQQQDDEVTEDDETVPFEPPFRGRGPAGPTYEAALASNKQEITIGGNAEPDLSDAQLKGPVQSGSFVSECGAPDSMKVTVKIAVKLGRPVGVSIYTSPHDPDIAGCIDRYVRTFSWPSSSKMDSFTTTY